MTSVSRKERLPFRAWHHCKKRKKENEGGLGVAWIKKRRHLLRPSTPISWGRQVALLSNTLHLTQRSRLRRVVPKTRPVELGGGRNRPEAQPETKRTHESGRSFPRVLRLPTEGSPCCYQGASTHPCSACLSSNKKNEPRTQTRNDGPSPWGRQVGAQPRRLFKPEKNVVTEGSCLRCKL